MNPLLTIYVLLICYFYPNESARILGVFPSPAYSHYVLGSRLMKELAVRQHNVTVISPFTQKLAINNYRDIELKGFVEAFREERKNQFKENEVNFLLFEVVLNNFFIDLMEKVFKQQTVKNLLQSNETFDLVIIEECMSYALKSLCYRFKAPCIMFSSIGPFRIINSQVGNPSLPSHISDFNLNYSTNMDFFQRVHNFCAYLFGEFYKHAFAFPKHNRIIQKYLPGTPDISELFYNVSLAFVNSHVSTHPAMPLVPNMIDIGGFHIQPPKQLPKDLKEYLDNAKEGAIYFSMGSNLKSVALPPEKRDAILRAFSRLKQKVLWKWEDENLPGKPANVKIGKWLPQSDILAHPNIKLFVTHCGLLSTIEAAYRGVPVVGIPIYGDQKINLANAVSNGMGLGVSYSTLTEKTLFSVINEVLTTPRFYENAKRRLKIMQDQPINPLAKAVFWTEYVIRHRGAPHLRIAALNLSWYQYLLLDVVLFLVITATTAAAVLYWAMRNLLFGNKRSQTVTKTKKAS